MGEPPGAPVQVQTAPSRTNQSQASFHVSSSEDILQGIDGIRLAAPELNSAINGAMTLAWLRFKLDDLRRLRAQISCQPAVICKIRGKQGASRMMRNSSWVFVQAAALAFAMWAVSAYGQTISGSIAGRVPDPQMAPVQGATVTLTEPSRSFSVVTRNSSALTAELVQCSRE